MEPIITWVKSNMAASTVVVIVLIPIMFIFQKKTAPIIFHSIEYALYLCIAHFFVIYPAIKVIVWYRSQTPDIEWSGGKPYEIPFNPITQNFLDRSLYNPTGLLYFELLIAFGLLYIVVIVRPTTYTKSNKYKGNKDRGMPGKGGSSNRRSRYDRSKASGNRSQKS